MNELLNISLIILTITFLTSSGRLLLRRNFENYILNLDSVSKNLILLLNIIWMSSIFNFSKSNFLIFLLFTSFVSILFINKKNFLKFKFDLLAIFTILLVFILSVSLANDLFLGHDARLYWIEKAKIFYNDQFVNNDNTIKKEYPHYGTYLWAFFWQNSILNYEYLGRISYIFIYVFSISYLVNSLRIKVILKMCLVIILVLLTYENKHFDGRQDILFFSYNMFIARFLYEIILEKKEIFKNLILTILTLNLIIWTKTEGILYLIVYGLILIFFIEKRLKFITAISFILLFTIKFYFYIYWDISLNPSGQMYDKNIFQRLGEIDIIYRSYSIIYWYIINLIKTPLMLVSIIFTISIFLIDKKFLIKFNYIIIFYLFITLGIFASYLPTLYDFPFAMIGSFDRIIMQHSGIFLMPVLHFFKRYLS